MSAAVQFPSFARFAVARRSAQPHLAACHGTPPAAQPPLPAVQPAAPVPGLAFYRNRTEGLLRRYLLASMLVGRRPTILTDPVTRGWASHRVVETFEDCVIFVLDIEKCLDRLSALDRVLISRIVLQEYSEAETALLINRSERNVRSRFRAALDHLTEILLDTGILRRPYRGAPCPEID
jgi:hypothetical protein